MEIDTDLGVGDIVEKVVNGIASIIWSAVVWIATAAVTLFQWAFSLELVNMVADAVGGMIRAIRDSIYAPFLQAMIVVTGAWAVWHALVKRRGLLATEGLVWCVALLLVTVFFSIPEGFVRGANNLSAGVSRAVLEGISVLDPDQSTQDGASFDTDEADNQLRASADRWWRTYVYVPWSVMEFGDPQLADRYGEAVLSSKTITAEEWEQIDDSGGMRADNARRLIEEKADAYGDVKADMERDHPEALEWFNGHHPFQRAGIALLTLVVVLFAGGLLILLSGAVLLMQLALIMLVVLAPLFLLLGILPGAGRVIALRWVETIVGLLVKRVALSAQLATTRCWGRAARRDLEPRMGRHDGRLGPRVARRPRISQSRLCTYSRRRPFQPESPLGGRPPIWSARAETAWSRADENAARWRRTMSHAAAAYVGGKVADSSNGTNSSSSAKNPEA